MIYDTDQLLNMPCYIIDFLPQQVAPDRYKNYSKVENYLLNYHRIYNISPRIINIILKLMCYYNISVSWGGYKGSPHPEMIAEIVNKIMDNHSGTLEILFPDDEALLVFEWDCLHISVYNPNEEMQCMLSDIASSEGMFFRKSPWE